MALTYVQTSGVHQTTSPQFTPIPGLALMLPEGVQTEAIVILNVPNPYATGNDYPGANFGIAVDGKVLEMYACFTTGTQQPMAYGRVPTTLVVGVPLAGKPQKIQAMWSGVRGSNVIIDTPASLCYMLD